MLNVSNIINLKIKKITEDAFECNGVIVNTRLDGIFEIFKNENEFITYFNDIDCDCETSHINPLKEFDDLWKLLNYLNEVMQ